MGTYIIRLGIYAIIICIAVAVGRYVATTLFDLVAFHITIYEYILTGQERLGTLGTQAQNAFDTVFGGSEGIDTANSSLQNNLTIQERINKYTVNVRIVFGIIGVLTATRVYKTLTSIVFSAKKHLQAVQAFIGSKRELKEI